MIVRPLWLRCVRSPYFRPHLCNSEEMHLQTITMSVIRIFFLLHAQGR